MKQTPLIAVCIALAAVLAFVFYVSSDGFPREGEQGETNIVENMEVSLPLQTNEEGGVTVAVAPILEKEVWSFEVEMNTHSVELGDDLLAVSVLIDDRGNEYAPIAWEGDPPGGHHRSGILKFSPLSPLPASLELTMRGVGGVPERKFLWTTRF